MREHTQVWRLPTLMGVKVSPASKPYHNWQAATLQHAAACSSTGTPPAQLPSMH